VAQGLCQVSWVGLLDDVPVARIVDTLDDLLGGLQEALTRLHRPQPNPAQRFKAARRRSRGRLASATRPCAIR
jgi:hypothetical protein